jgi:pyridoxamine 5'-phosphate oxidase
MPFQKIKEWIALEKNKGSTNPDCIVLATSDRDAIPHSRIVAIKEMSEPYLLFFTQPSTRKALEIKENPVASATLWLPLQQREVMMDGIIHTLTDEENESYWKQLPRERQLKFASYAPTSDQPIESLDILNQKQATLAAKYPSGQIPMNNFYCGYRLEIHTFYFYTLGSDSFSEYVRFKRVDGEWQKQLLSP